MFRMSLKFVVNMGSYGCAKLTQSKTLHYVFEKIDLKMQVCVQIGGGATEHEATS